MANELRRTWIILNDGNIHSKSERKRTKIPKRLAGNPTHCRNRVFINVAVSISRLYTKSYLTHHVRSGWSSVFVSKVWVCSDAHRVGYRYPIPVDVGLVKITTAQGDAWRRWSILRLFLAVKGIARSTDIEFSNHMLGRKRAFWGNARAPTNGVRKMLSGLLL